MIKIALGSDHGGIELKAVIKDWLIDHQYEVLDFGTNNADSCDYPDIGVNAANAVASGLAQLGILICGTGIGMSISANKVPGIRAALCHDCYSAQMSRAHNNANILALGQRVTGQGLALHIVETWLAASFEGGRHQRRLDKIAALEDSSKEM